MQGSTCGILTKDDTWEQHDGAGDVRGQGVWMLFCEAPSQHLATCAWQIVARQQRLTAKRNRRWASSSSSSSSSTTTTTSVGVSAIVNVALAVAVRGIQGRDSYAPVTREHLEVGVRSELRDGLRRRRVLRCSIIITTTTHGAEGHCVNTRHRGRIT